jgi:hypothetical protein
VERAIKAEGVASLSRGAQQSEAFSLDGERLDRGAVIK